MRVLFCGGGTAGHVNPAIAVAQTIMRNSSNSKVAYVVTIDGIENTLVDFKKYCVDVIGLKRALTVKNFSFVAQQLKAIDKCKEFIRAFRQRQCYKNQRYTLKSARFGGFCLHFSGSSVSIRCHCGRMHERRLYSASSQPEGYFRRRSVGGWLQGVFL